MDSGHSLLHIGVIYSVAVAIKDFLFPEVYIWTDIAEIFPCRVLRFHDRLLLKAVGIAWMMRK